MNQSWKDLPALLFRFCLASPDEGRDVEIILGYFRAHLRWLLLDRKLFLPGERRPDALLRRANGHRGAGQRLHSQSLGFDSCSDDRDLHRIAHRLVKNGAKNDIGVFSGGLLHNWTLRELQTG